MSDAAVICSHCQRRVYFARVWDDEVMCSHCSTAAEINLRILKHESETDMRGHDVDGLCCLRARLGG